jgi:RNA polymerase sigma-70 factor (ECF subfamily)
VRTKSKLKQAGVPFRVPERKELPARLGEVLDAIYAAFGHGWSDPGGTDVARRHLNEESIFLASLLCDLLPEEPEALGLLALMLHAEARRRARRSGNGDFVPLEKQDPGLWDEEMIERAESLLRGASVMDKAGRYQLEAALQSAHVHRMRTGEANWPEVVQLYDGLLAITASPVIAINRAIAIAETEGADAALEAMPSADEITALAEYQPYWAARASLLARAGCHEEAGKAYQIAIGLESDPAVRRFLQRLLSNLRI